jgi:hypothetical protein
MGVLSIMRVMVFVENADENIFLPLFFGSCCLLCHFAAHDDDNTTEEEEEEEEDSIAGRRLFCLSPMESFQEKGSHELLKKRKEDTTIATLLVEQWLSMLKKEMMMMMMKTRLLGEDCLSSMEGFKRKGVKSSSRKDRRTLPSLLLWWSNGSLC